MFKFQKFHFRTEKIAKSGFIHQRIVVCSTGGWHCLKTYTTDKKIPAIGVRL